MAVQEIEEIMEQTTQSLNVDDISNAMKRFGAIDYAVFVIMLCCCSMVGLYFGYLDHKKQRKSRHKERRGSAAADYLMGGRNMQVFPVAMSLVASFVSGITLLGTSTEIYLYGTQYCYIIFSILLTGVCMHYVFIPVFHELQITSTYEYLQIRYDRRMRLFGSLMFTIATILWMPIVIYVPALAFNQTTGIDIHYITPIVCLVCIFYTCLGGIKAVVWTDVIQIMIMYGVLILIVVKGTLHVGGLSVVIERNWNSGRFEAPNFDIDPTIRHSFWTMVIGGTIFWTNVNGLNQNMIQRYMALKDVKTARKGQLIYIVGVTIMIFLCVYNGLLIYATYHDCDPLTTKLAKAKDQLLPLLVLEILKDLPGLPGLFIAGVFSAALSSLSTGLNSMSAVVLEDFCKPYAKNDISEKTTNYIMRGTVFVLGILSVVLVYVVQHMGSVLQLSMSISASCFGPLMGLYAMGLTLPWINKNASFIGALVSLFWGGYLSIKSQAEISLGIIKYDMKPTSIEGCLYNFTQIITSSTTQSTPLEAPEKQLHHMSYLYYTGFSAVVTIVIAIFFTFILGREDSSQIDRALLAPFLRKFYKLKTTRTTLTAIDKDKECVTIAFDMKNNVCT